MSCSNPFYDNPPLESPSDVVSITVKPPTKRLYNCRENIDLTGASVNIYYRDRQKYPPNIGSSLSNSNLSGFDSSKDGIQTITVTVKGKTDTFDVAVMSPIGKPEQITPINGKVNIDAQNGSWKIYIYNKNSGSLSRDTDKGKSSSISFDAPSNGTYIIVVSLNIQEKIYYRFYELTVS
jgi:hypothetical protein